MATISLQGQTLHTSGDLPSVGEKTPDFSLVTTALGAYSLSSDAGSMRVLNIFPSIDTPTCAMSTRVFHKAIATYPNAKVLCISADLPFALQRFCGAEGIDRVITLSCFRDQDFGHRYGVRLVDGPLAGLLARAVVVIDGDGVVRYTQLVHELSDEPDYTAALQAIQT